MAVGEIHAGTDITGWNSQRDAVIFERAYTPFLSNPPAEKETT